ncbi:unnamed protein product [Strongylus vulgaris]|uniref:Tyrosine specific protein phosphatases domain-containing protein n=1 Tax=Strongylus vulgaris TaxID=40348 RepID=A0A3P7IXJ4_STRVU|nr:unnamed protein product [Strongylus vulgaris]
MRVSAGIVDTVKLVAPRLEVYSDDRHETRVLSPEEVTVVVCILKVRFARADGTVDTRDIRHYQWQDWPDRGVPPCRLTSMELLSRVRGTTKPIVVHCSAGIGRTGTIVAIEYILGQTSI